MHETVVVGLWFYIFKEDELKGLISLFESVLFVPLRAKFNHKEGIQFYLSLCGMVMGMPNAYSYFLLWVH